jgi:hypothetical protein
MRWEGLKILIIEKDSENTNKTSNVVYKEVFRNIISIAWKFIQIYCW